MAKKAAAVKPMTKTEVLNSLVDSTELTKKEVSSVLTALGELVGKELSKGAKTAKKSFTIPGICKLTTVYKPATKGGEKKINSFTGEEYITQPKPASQRVRVNAVKAIKDAVQ